MTAFGRKAGAGVDAQAGHDGIPSEARPRAASTPIAD
jgi:hypothetical protein